MVEGSSSQKFTVRQRESCEVGGGQGAGCHREKQWEGRFGGGVDVGWVGGHVRQWGHVETGEWGASSPDHDVVAKGVAKGGDGESSKMAFLLWDIKPGVDDGATFHGFVGVSHRGVKRRGGLGMGLGRDGGNQDVLEEGVSCLVDVRRRQRGSVNEVSGVVGKDLGRGVRC